MKQNRWKSKLLWLAIVAQVVAIGQVTGFWTHFGIDQNIITNTAAAVLQLLVIIGVVNDPTNKVGW